MTGHARSDHGMTDGEIAEVQASYGKGPSVATDIAVVTARWSGDDPSLELLLIKRKNKPFQGMWALPGGFVDLGEDLEPAARRELSEETGIVDTGPIPMEQVGTFGNPVRDPRGRTISVVYLAWVGEDRLVTPRGGDDASDAAFVRWCNGRVVGAEENAHRLAFDHDMVLACVWERMRQRAALSSVALVLLPNRFTTEQLVALYEALLGPSDPGTLVAWVQAHGWIRSEGPLWMRSEVFEATPIATPWTWTFHSRRA